MIVTILFLTAFVYVVMALQQSDINLIIKDLKTPKVHLLGTNLFETCEQVPSHHYIQYIENVKAACEIVKADILTKSLIIVRFGDINKNLQVMNVSSQQNFIHNVWLVVDTVPVETALSNSKFQLRLSPYATIFYMQECNHDNACDKPVHQLMGRANLNPQYKVW